MCYQKSENLNSQLRRKVDMVISYRGYFLYINEDNLTVQHKATGIINIITKIKNIEEAYFIVDNHIHNSIESATLYEESLRTILTSKQYSQYYSKGDKRNTI